MAAETESLSEFQETPQGSAERWKREISAAKKAIATAHSEGRTALDWYLNKKDLDSSPSRLSLFTMTVQVQKSVMYGQVPKALVARRYADADDDVARVAATIQERHLNSDIESDSDTYAQALDSCLDDELVPGMCQARLRYVREMKKEPVPALGVDGEPLPLDEEGKPVGQVAAEAYEKDVLHREAVEVDWVPWDEFLYSPCRNHSQLRWQGFLAKMGVDALVKKFGEVGKSIPLDANTPKESSDRERQAADPWRRASVWEIWDKDTKRVYFYVENFDSVLTPLDVPKEQRHADGGVLDPLKLEAFFPAPEPIIDNTTNSAYISRPDFAFTQDQYRDLNLVCAKESQLLEALKVAGLYNEEFKTDLTTLVKAGPNDMIPVHNWKVFAEKGGIEANIAWFPLQQVVATLDKLGEKKAALISDIFMTTGIGDILHGQGSDVGVTATEQALKAKFGSVRMRKKQLRFAKFATDILRIKGEIIAKHFDPKTILERSNIMNTADADKAEAAVALIKSDWACYRIEVKPEAISLADSASLKQQRGEWMTSFAAFFTATAPIAQQSPASVPFLLRIAQWSLAPLEGSSTVEGEFDRMIAAAEKAAQAPPPSAQPQQPDPGDAMKLQTQMLKGQQDQEKIKAELQADGIRTQMEVAADKQREWDQAEANNWERQRQNSLLEARRSQTEAAKPNGGVQ